MFVAEQIFTQAMHGSVLLQLSTYVFLDQASKIKVQWGDNGWLSNL
jgi:hypothetical protein